MRLEKYLADCGIGSRSQCKAYIRQGLIKVNEMIVTDGATQVTKQDKINFKGTPLILTKGLYYMFHKPAGCVCALKDPSQKTVLEYFDAPLSKKLLIVGRLDKDTEGLLLLTDDGDFLHHLTSPRRHVAKTYYFEAVGKLSTDAVRQVEEGMDIGDAAFTKPGILTVMAEEDALVSGTLTIYEGRFHQVKRMIKALGCQVTYLKRLSIGGLTLDEHLNPGEFRPLTEAEKQILLLDKEGKEV
ncbi:MAG: rRNA pseudouridine synthase [Lachnospiraceae bacterium]|nr:rRNA pseudouridine synthase [Lachnospiraceae bacterium]